MSASSPQQYPDTGTPHRQTAQALSCATGRINIKATTTEGMGFCGTGEGMAAFAEKRTAQFRDR